MRRNLTIAAVAILVLLLIGSIAVAVRYRHRLRPILDWGRTQLASREARANDTLTNVLFVHHSTGQALIAEGNVREILTEAGYDFWDHHYNPTGLTRPDGSLAGYSYNIPQDNTDPDGFARLFAQRVYRRPINALSAILQHRVILFKSCFPVSDIASRDQLETYKSYYLGIRDAIDQHPDHLFIALTPPPLVPESTTPENAARAREWSEWLQSDAFLSGHPNLVVFDLFGLWAEGDPAAPDYNMLRQEYRLQQQGDSHPNTLANQTVGPELARFVIQTVEARR